LKNLTLNIKNFIKSLKREDNKYLIESILKGYNVLFENEGRTMQFDPTYVKRIFPIKFLNKPDYIKDGCMALSVVKINPWVVLVRGLRQDDDLGSVIAFARGEDLNNLTLDETPLIKASEKWDALGCEDPTFTNNGFYYSGVEKGKNGNVKTNLCFSDLEGNKKLITKHDETVAI